MYYVTPHWAEYGNCKINMRMGIQPPFSGHPQQSLHDSCGAYIRSEIWACLAPGCPETAVSYACRDALVDHGEGEGLYAEAFCAAIESAAFVEHDIRTLIHIGLSYIPEECAIAKAVRLAESLYDRRVPGWRQEMKSCAIFWAALSLSFPKRIEKKDSSTAAPAGRLRPISA